jgi:hypothetical protein
VRSQLASMPVNEHAPEPDPEPEPEPDPDPLPSPSVHTLPTHV